MKIILESYNNRYIFESENDDYSAEELREIFSRLLVSATFSPDVIELSDGGYFVCEYKEGTEK